jgi:hypothetical protein
MEITAKKYEGGSMMEEEMLLTGKAWLVADYVNLTIEEKKRGFSRVLVGYLDAVRTGRFGQQKSKILADYLHTLPHFLGEDLKNFDDEMFWDRVLDNKRYSSYITGWFRDGVFQNNWKYKFIEEMQERRNKEKAE